MITFSQMLAEGRDAPLYRGMMLDYLAWDLADNIMKARTEHFIVPIKSYAMSHDERKSKLRMGISTTRSYSFAKGWAQETHNMDSGRMNNGNKPMVPCVVELDQRIISQRNKILPYNFFAIVGEFNTARDRETQLEEFIIGDIKPLRPVVKKIIFWGDMREQHKAIERIRWIRSTDVLKGIPMEWKH